MKPELIKDIRSGRRTMFRIPVKGDCRYQPKRCYTLRAATDQSPALQITVLEVREERLGSISLRDVKREGFRTTREFFSRWERTYGPKPPREILEVEDDMERAEQRRAWWAERRLALPLPALPDLVHVISFASGDLTDTPHLLAARPGGAQGDYTTIPARAVKGEGEAVQSKLLEKWSAESRERHADVLAEQRERALRAIGTVRLEAARQNAGSPSARKRLKLSEHQIRAQEQEARRSA